jgi:hypothetical protein
MYTEQALTILKDYFSVNIPGQIALIEQALELDPGDIPALAWFDNLDLKDGNYPNGILIEKQTNFADYELTKDLEILNISINFEDHRADKAVLRRNLYAYRDAVVELVKRDAPLSGTVLESDFELVRLKTLYPYAAFKDSGTNTYTGYSKLDIEIQKK